MQSIIDISQQGSSFSSALASVPGSPNASSVGELDVKFVDFVEFDEEVKLEEFELLTDVELSIAVELSVKFAGYIVVRSYI